MKARALIRVFSVFSETSVAKNPGKTHEPPQFIIGYSQEVRDRARFAARRNVFRRPVCLPPLT